MRDTTHLQVLRDTLLLIERLRPVVERVKRHDRSLADQLKRASTSIALNLAEGNASRDGHRRKRFETALGSAQETRVGLKVAKAWGYLEQELVSDLDTKLDSIAARIFTLARR